MNFNISFLFQTALHYLTYFVLGIKTVILFKNLVCCGDMAAEKLYHDIMIANGGYNKLIRPVDNGSTKLTVRVGLRLTQIIKVVSMKNLAAYMFNIVCFVRVCVCIYRGHIVNIISTFSFSFGTRNGANFLFPKTFFQTLLCYNLPQKLLHP